ncbi:MAG: hypothetical protein FMNOHCHN_03722 [Ignavibacteriaceae bacterium]|nr:hypothetical protein [Ignavibacteriaceae bacterium]
MSMKDFLSKRYEQLAARLGDAMLRSERLQDQINLLKQEIEALDKLAPTLLRQEESKAADQKKVLEALNPKSLAQDIKASADVRIKDATIETKQEN